MCVSITELNEFVRYEKVISGAKTVKNIRMQTELIKKRLPENVISFILSNFWFKLFCKDSLTKVSQYFLTCSHNRAKTESLGAGRLP